MARRPVFDERGAMPAEERNMTCGLVAFASEARLKAGAAQAVVENGEKGMR